METKSYFLASATSRSSKCLGEKYAPTKNNNKWSRQAVVCHGGKFLFLLLYTIYLLVNNMMLEFVTILKQKKL